MKASTVLKIIIALTAVAVIAYVVYNNNKAAEINNLVSHPTAPYEFTAHVDSVCDNITKSSDLANAKGMYDRLYEEIDVYTNIKDSIGDYLIDQKTKENLFAHAFQVYFPKVENDANTLFGTVNWSPSKNKLLRKEVDLLVDDKGNARKKGITQSQKTQLNNYKKYFKQYNNFSTLLDRLESCRDSLTYMKHNELSNYNSYPCTNLQSFQNRKSRAKESARSNWATYLGDQKRELTSAGNIILSSEWITDEMRHGFYDRMNEWKRKARQYENTVPGAEDRYYQQKYDLENMYERIARRQRDLQKERRDQENYNKSFNY